MEGLKWIKLATGLFNNRKIRQIGALPEGDTILMIWVQLLCLAGTINNAGLIYVTKNLPYTTEMLAEELRRPLNTVRLALSTFEKFDMIATGEDGLLQIVGWAEHQGGSAAIETAAEKNKLRQQRYRDRQKMLATGQGNAAENVTKNNDSNVTRNVTDNVTDDVTVTSRNACRIRSRNRIEKENDDDHTTTVNKQVEDAVEIFQNTVRPVKNLYEVERIRAMVEEFGLDAFRNGVEILKKARPKVPLPYLEEVLKNRDGPAGKNDPVAGAEGAKRIMESGEIVDFNSE